MMSTRRIDRLAVEMNRHKAELRDDTGLVTARVQAIADDVGYSERQVWRAVNALRSENSLPSIDCFSLDDDMIEVLAQTRGNIEGARKQLLQMNVDVPSASTFRRAALRDLGPKTLAGFGEGAHGMRRKQVYLKAQDRPRNHTWQTDHAHLPLRVMVDGHQTEVWFTSIIDVGSRVLLAYMLSVGSANAGSIHDVILRALFGSRAPDGSRLGGRPELILWDRGADFLSEIIQETVDAFEVLGIALPPFSPHRKGKIERFHKTLKAECIDFLPGVTRGPTNLRGDAYHEGEAVELVELEDAVSAYVTDYNFKRSHQGIGGLTPYEAWVNDPEPLRAAPQHKILDAMVKASKPRKMSHEGVAFKGRKFKPLFPNPPVGLSVQVRYLPNDLGSIEVFREGRHLGTAVDGDAMTSADLEAFLELRSQDTSRAHRTRRSAKARQLERTAVMEDALESHEVALATDGSLLADGPAALQSLLNGEETTDISFGQMEMC